MKLTLDSMRELYRLNSMVRYNTWQKVNTETVASHSFFVGLFTKIICDGLGVTPATKLLALEFALVHDAPESLMNDITYDAKKLMPGINELLEEFEKKYLGQHFPTTVGTAFGDDDGGMAHLARLIVKLADIYSVLQYCDNEVLLGNKRFDKLLQDSRNRAHEIHTKIEKEFKLSCQKITIYVQ